MKGIEGPQLRLRLVRPDDAAYVHALRTDEQYNTHLSPVTGGIAEQRAWIERYKAREAAGTEFYYVIEHLSDGPPCGLVRLYDIAQDHFTWGSWILGANKPPKAALESATLSFRLGFGGLGAQLAHIDVRKDNGRALAFYRRYGMTQTGEDSGNFYFEYERSRFEQDEEAFLSQLSIGVTS